MDIRKIKTLIDLLNQTGISEIEIKEGEESVRVSRHHGDAYTTTPKVHHVEVASHAPAKSEPAPQVSATTVAPHKPGHVIHSPMVGTLYMASSPESPPFVTIGHHVQSGDTLCIIEAMKMFNEVESDKGGKIIDILVKNGEPVEYNQPLFVIEE